MAARNGVKIVSRHQRQRGGGESISSSRKVIKRHGVSAALSAGNLAAAALPYGSGNAANNNRGRSYHGGGMATVRGKQVDGVGGMGIKRRKHRRRATWRQHSADVNGNIGRGKAAREQARHAAAAPAAALVRAHRVGVRRIAAARRIGGKRVASRVATRRSPQSYRRACFSCIPPATSHYYARRQIWRHWRRASRCGRQKQAAAASKAATRNSVAKITICGESWRHVSVVVKYEAALSLNGMAASLSA
jgi:hypothetical protein